MAAKAIAAVNFPAPGGPTNRYAWTGLATAARSVFAAAVLAHQTG